MSQRELLIVLAHTHVCGACRDRLLSDPSAALVGRPLTPDEKSVLGRLEFSSFITPHTLARAAGISAQDLESYRDEPVVRLRHL